MLQKQNTNAPKANAAKVNVVVRPQLQPKPKTPKANVVKVNAAKACAAHMALLPRHQPRQLQARHQQQRLPKMSKANAVKVNVAQAK